MLFKTTGEEGGPESKHQTSKQGNTENLQEYCYIEQKNGNIWF